MEQYTKRVADKLGLTREKYKTPHSDSYLAIPFFGDKKHEFLLATTLLNHITDKYKIVVSWPGHSEWFLGADEYWSISESLASRMIQGSKGWGNESSMDRQLLHYFDVFTEMDLCKYYHHGFTKQFLEKNTHIHYTVPEQPTIKSTLIKLLTNSKQKIFVYCNKKMQYNHNSNIKLGICKYEFWEDLLKKLIARNYHPVIYVDDASYDLSLQFHRDATFISHQRILDIFAIMRNCACVLDICSGISRWAIAARTPFLAIVDRNVYYDEHENEIDTLFASDIPHQYIFAVPTMIDCVVNMIPDRLDRFLPQIDKLPHVSKLSIMLPYQPIVMNEFQTIGKLIW